MAKSVYATIPTLDDVRDLLQRAHGEPHHTPAQTLDRLWTGHLAGDANLYGSAFARAAPRSLVEGNTLVSVELWPLNYLFRLIKKEPRKKEMRPGDPNAPVVIVRFRGNSCLIDGGRRITKWVREDPGSDHVAWIISVR